MSLARFVLRLSGQSCSGKTTLTAALTERLPGMYVVSYDRQKWQLAGYDRAKDGPLVNRLVARLFRAACEEGVPILLDFFFKDEAEYLAARGEAERTGYAFIDVELQAPLEVRLERFRKRLKEMQARGAKVSVTDEKTFLEIAERPFYVPPGTPVFDTSVTPITEIADRVVRELLPAAARPIS